MGKCHRGLILLAGLMAVLVACTTVEAPSADATPFPFTIMVLTPTPPSQAPECPVALCCFHCPTFPVTRVIDGDTFVSGRMTNEQMLRIRLYGVDTPERGEPCFDEATERGEADTGGFGTGLDQGWAASGSASSIRREGAARRKSVYVVATIRERMGSQLGDCRRTDSRHRPREPNPIFQSSS